MLEAISLSKSYDGSVAVKDLNLRIDAGEVFSLLGANGAGKTTTILMAAHDLFRAKESATRVGIMKHGTLVATLPTKEIGHADLERIYLEHMHE